MQRDRVEKMKTKKYLGQHFLRSQKALNQIIEAADISAGDIILEIGPGEGVLTEKLLQLAGKVTALEKDVELIPNLRERFNTYINEGKLEVIKKDALLFDTESLRLHKGLNYKLVANIPYYITGAIIEKYLSATYQPQTMVLLMQKEVAERIVAKDKKESILSVAVKVYGKPKIIARVPPGAFAPAPTVDSAILLVENINRDFFSNCNESDFFSILKAVFGKKRKQIGGSLAEYLGDRSLAQKILILSNINLKSRPEDLNLEQWKKITQSFNNLK